MQHSTGTKGTGHVRSTAVYLVKISEKRIRDPYAFRPTLANGLAFRVTEYVKTVYNLCQEESYCRARNSADFQTMSVARRSGPLLDGKADFGL